MSKVYDMGYWGSKDVGIRKFKFVAKTQFLYPEYNGKYIYCLVVEVLISRILSTIS